MNATLPIGGEGGIGGMRRQHRQRPASVRHRFALGALDVVVADGALPCRARGKGKACTIEHPVARPAGCRY
jgi:hypothetical protein